MRDVAVVAFAQSHCTTANLHDDMAEILLPVVRDALAQADLRRTDIDFTRPVAMTSSKAALSHT